MKRVLYFATKLNSRDIQKCDCLWERQLAFTDWETRSRLSPSPWLLEGGVGIQKCFLNQNLDLPPPQWTNQGLCWRVQVNQFFSSYIRGSLVGRKTFYLCIMKIALIMCILEEQETYLLRAVSNHSVSCGSVVPCVETSPLKANNRDWALRKPMN